MNNVTCDECQMIFSVKSEKRRHGKDVVELFFTCPNCHAHYTGVILDEQGRKMQRDVRKLQERIAKLRSEHPDGSVKEEQLTRQLGALGQKIANRMNKLKKKYVKEAVNL